MMRPVIFILLIISTRAYSQKDFYSSRNVKKITMYRQRSSPNLIAKERYSYITFDRHGNIIETYKPYYTLSTGPDKFYYDSNDKLVKLESYKNENTLNSVLDFSDSNSSRPASVYSPPYPDEVEFSLEETISNMSRKEKDQIVVIDTIHSGENKSLVRITRDFQVKKTYAYFDFYKNRLLSFTAFAEIDTIKKQTLLYLFDKNERLVEKMTVNERGGDYFHFKFTYYQNGLLKKYDAYSKEGKIQETCWYKAEYYN